VLRPSVAGTTETNRRGTGAVKITAFQARTVCLPLVEGYRITGKTITSCQNHLVRVAAGGFYGFGSASPSGDVTGEDDAMCIAALENQLADLTTGFQLEHDVSAWAEAAFNTAPDCPAARAAVDMALWDLIAKKAGEPLVRLWGGEPEPIATSVTIGICDAEQTMKEAESWLSQGFTVIKVKIGEDLDADVERLRQLRQLAGPDTRIRVDANQGFDLVGARQLLEQTAPFDIEMFEQPLPQADLAAFAALTAASPVPIVADESAGTVAECIEVIDRNAAHGVNIKLMKCGGPTPARFIHDYAQSAGLSLMLGCNDETRISIAAGVHLAQSMAGLQYADLDGHMDLASDPSSGGFEVVNGCLVLSNRPGLGTEIDW